MSTPPDFETLNEMLLEDRVQADAAELQGCLCAQLTVSGELSMENWLSVALGDEFGAALLDRSTGQALADLFAWTRERLHDSELGFRLFLPDDDVSLGARTEALSHWCHGYLSGLGLAGIGTTTGLPEETREFLEDVNHIARADFESDDYDEGDEVAFTELVEYARVGAMLVFETLRGPDETESVH